MLVRLRSRSSVVAEGAIAIARDIAGPTLGTVRSHPPSRRIANVTGGPSVSTQNGWEYSDVRDAFLYWNGGPDVWAFKIQDSADRRFDTAVWTKISRGVLAPEMNVNGNWSRFRIARFDLGGSLVEVAVSVGNVGEREDDAVVYAFRVPNP
jgi:hypothetical protein